MVRKNIKNLFLLFPVVIFSLLFLRLFDLQIVQGQELRELSEQNRFFKKRVLASRGVLIDRFEKPIVINKPVYYQLSQPKRLYSERTLISNAEALRLLAVHPESVFTEQYREYLFPQALSQVTGYVGKVTKEDLDADQSLHLNQIIGKTGVERVFEQELRGVDGVETFELNAKGEIQRSISVQPPQAGQDVLLSIDAELSQKAYELLGEKKGAVIVGDAETGELLALVSSPTYNPNRFTLPTITKEEELQRKAELQNFFEDPQKLFFNRTLAGAYPPGSVFKLVTALAGLELNKFDTDTTVVDEGVLKVDEYQFGNWYYRQYGRVEGAVNVVKAISRSNDIYFYKAAEWIGPTELANFSRLFGLGTKTGIELPAEASGTVPDPAWKERVIGEKWYLGNTYHFGIGQGDLTVTPLQVFQYTTAFGNKGKMCQPTLLKGKSGNCKELTLDEGHLQTVREGMIQACSSGGTGYPFFEVNAQREEKVACKTGTAEFGAANEKGHRRTHGWFTAIADVSNGTSNYPHKIVFTVLVESDEEQPFKEGSRDAAPIAFELLKWIEEQR